MSRTFSSSSICTIIIILLSIISITIEAMTDPCTTNFDKQQLKWHNGEMANQSSKSCQEACAAQQQWGDTTQDTNGMCVFDQCYCTDVGIGTCQDNNDEGCDDICQSLSLDWVGVCSDGDCHCLL
ncbi:hypothetical protein BC941DRAFT_466185 [Chlamydoabsidia padenii]|nr:hypothetical protein BC941DRAFT_466185 [Chlamydoabsidia padenii]